MSNIKMDLTKRQEDEQRRARNLPVAGDLESSTGTDESTVVGSSEPVLPKSNSGAPMSGYERMARLAAGRGETYGTPKLY